MAAIVDRRSEVDGRDLSWLIDVCGQEATGFGPRRTLQGFLRCAHVRSAAVAALWAITRDVALVLAQVQDFLEEGTEFVSTWACSVGAQRVRSLRASQGHKEAPGRTANATSA